MDKTTVSVMNNLNVTAYAVGTADGSTNIIVVSKDATNGVHATIDVGDIDHHGGAYYLQGPFLDGTTGLTVGGAAIDLSGRRYSPSGPIPLAVSGSTVTGPDVPAAPAQH